MTDQQAPERMWRSPVSGVVLQNEPPIKPWEWQEYARADLLEAAEKRIAELEAEMKEVRLSRVRLSKCADQALAREASLKSSYDEERKDLVENIRLRVRIKELEGERDQALASVGAVIEARDMMGRLWATAVEEREQQRSDKFNAIAALNKMLEDARDEGRLSSALDRNPYRKDAT